MEGSGREDTGKARTLESLEEMMGMSNLVKKTQGFSKKIIWTLTMLVNQKKSYPLCPMERLPGFPF